MINSLSTLQGEHAISCEAFPAVSSWKSTLPFTHRNPWPMSQDNIGIVFATKQPYTELSIPMVQTGNYM